jgi:hypothetical protein
MSHQLTLADRYGMLAALLDDTLTDDERRSLNRLIRGIYRGQISVVDEISALLDVA